MNGGIARAVASAALLSMALAAACKREERIFHVSPQAASVPETVMLSELHPAQVGSNAPVKSEYEQTAQSLSEGKTLFQKMNCVGCHAHGGGGMGPALIDDKWIYGSDPDQVYATILQGRPNGMPSFHGKLTNHQLWELAAYVRSLGGLTPKDPATGRGDHMNVKQPENSAPKQQPKSGEVSKSAEGTQ